MRLEFERNLTHLPDQAVLGAGNFVSNRHLERVTILVQREMGLTFLASNDYNTRLFADGIPSV
jgi:hypothetical protein